MNTQQRLICRIALPLFSSLLFWSAVAPAATISYTYDTAGRLIKADYGGGTFISYTYDSGGNLLQRNVTQPFTATVYVSAGNCGGHEPCYHTLDEAVSNAPNNAVIKVAAEVFVGNAMVNADKTLIFEWGYNSDFAANTGVTQVQGSFTAKHKTVIRSGTLRAKSP